jgi:hypothetical protein
MKNVGNVQRRAFQALKFGSKELFWSAVSDIFGLFLNLAPDGQSHCFIAENSVAHIPLRELSFTFSGQEKIVI